LIFLTSLNHRWKNSRVLISLGSGSCELFYQFFRNSL